jgi:ABC-type Fe3+-hydroxamate transport system substrate-binding protein
MKKVFTDQTGNAIVIDNPPQRIVSLVPSLTEFLFDLQLENEIVGITRFCVHPSEECRKKIKVGGTKDFDISGIIDLNPDFILSSKEENTKEGIEELMKRFPVWISDIKNLDDAFEMMTEVGKITNKQEKALEISERIRSNFQSLERMDKKIRVAYFIWRRPYMSVGGDTFIGHLLDQLGFENVFHGELRYPLVSAEMLSELKPDKVLLSSEPYPFKSKHVDEFQKICPDSEVILVDGEYFSWYGSRLLKSTDYFKELIGRIN